MENNYRDYLNSYAWKAIKKMKLEEQSDCECCGVPATTVHHLSYERRGSEREDDIVSICEKCHYECHHVNGYQIKNDEEILRRRFEEVRGESSISEKVNVDNNIQIIELSGKDISGLIYISDDYFTKDGEIYFRYEKAYSESCVHYAAIYFKLVGVFLDNLEIINRYIIKYYDRYYVFFQENYTYVLKNIEEINEIDLKTFKRINKYFTRDSNNLFYLGEKINYIFPDNITIFNNNYISDTNFVYFKSDKKNFFPEESESVEFNILEGADILTFEKINDQYFKDKNYVYEDGKRLQGVDPKTFEVNK